jgi:nucleoside phosphorylase
MEAFVKVLIVEDNQTKAASIAAVLRDCGVATEDIVAVMDATSAKLLLRERYFELAVVDIAIPWQVDGEVVRDGGVRFANEVFGDENIRCPMHMMGLTGYCELASADCGSLPSSVFSIQYFDPGSDEWSRALRIRLKQIRAAGDTRAGEVRKADLAIICALDDPELSSVLNLNWNWSETVVQSDPSVYYEGTCVAGNDTKRVVAVAAAAMGLTAAAVATSKVINTFRPSYVAMVGIAAGVPSRVRLGDVIVANPVWDWGSGKWTAKKGSLKFHPAPSQLDVEPNVRNQCRKLAADAAMLARVKAGFAGDKPATDLQLHVGPLASGASVLADGETVALILEQNRLLLGVDMEAYAVLAAALESTFPRPSAFVVKGVVDFADGRKHDRYQKYAAYCSAAILEILVSGCLFTT